MSGNSTSSPPSEDNSSSPPPPSKDDSSSPPPPSKDSPPPPDSSSSPPSNNNNNNGGSDNNNNNNSGDNNNNNSGDNNNNNSGDNNNNGSNNNGNNNNNNGSNNNGNNNNNNGSGNNNNGNNNNNGDNNNNNNNNNNGDDNNNNNNGDNNNRSPPPPSASSNKNSHGPPPPPPPPPPPRSHGKALAPPHKSSSSDDSSSGGNNSDIQTKALIGGVAGAAALLLFFMIACLCCCRKKKRKSHDQMYYYRDNSHGNKGNAYYNSGPHSNWMNPQSTEYHVKMPQSGAVSSEHGWAVPPPPPPPMTCSSDLSSAAFSGPYQPALPPPHPTLALGFNKSAFSYDDLVAATGGFAKANLLGQGGFGYVHKGVLPNGKEVAVKSLKSGSGQGEREFQAEVDIISRVHHRHLVSLVGYCIAGAQRMLVYEFVQNNTLEHHLHGQGVEVMDWSSRIRIALGSAKGFAYLHEDCHPRIIHRDIKTANILLDDHYEAKVADFGLAKLSNENYTHVSTRIMGTFGYLAPEYASSGKLTEKSDVYSYGVMLLELITGRRPVDVSSDDDTLIDWARPILMRATEGGSYDELVDPRLENNYDPEEMLRMVACAAACIRHSARRRPKMSQIVRALEGDASLEDLNEAVKTGHSSTFGSSGSSDYDGSYSVDMKKFRKAGLSSQEYTSSEHGVTGEFVHSSGGESQEMHPNRSRMHSP